MVVKNSQMMPGLCYKSSNCVMKAIGIKTLPLLSFASYMSGVLEPRLKLHLKNTRDIGKTVRVRFIARKKKKS